MKKFYWFGGSWVQGDELDKLMPKEQVHLTIFPYLVSSHFDAECVNMSENGSSIDTVLINFSKIVNTITPESTMFFCLPPQHRTSLFDDAGVVKNILPSGFKEFHKMHNHSLEWYKYFDSIPQQIFNRDRIINLLHLWCKDLNIRHYFFNDIGSTPDRMMDITPDSAWLIPRNSCNGEFILPVINQATRDVIMNDSPELPTEAWAQQQPFFEKYISPNYCHPNVNGHKKIAQELIKLLTNNE